VHGVNDFREKELNTVELLAPEVSFFKIAIEKLNRYKSPLIDQIIAKLIQVGGNTLCSEIIILIISTWNKE
jgi:hypothetical protein